MFDKPTAAIPKTPPSEADGAHGAQPAARPRRPSAGAEHVAAEPSAVRIPNVFDACIEYAVDAWQRSFLYADVMRERGNQYLEHLAQVTPNVLNFEAELVMSGLELARPVNYGLVRIVPPEGIELDPQKRPFVVVDPRAGHGPGIGGFKAESEIGVALRAGHTCYFVGFLPDPKRIASAAVANRRLPSRERVPPLRFAVNSSAGSS